MEKERTGFTGKVGFVLAAAGSAVGLGNIWRFPYLAAKYGGGMFLLVYLILSVTFGFTLLVAEIALGRKTGFSAIKAYSSLSKKSSFIGILTLIVPIIILPYYCVIGGWVSKYLFEFITGNASQTASDSYFSSFTAQPFEPLIFFAIFLFATLIFIVLGVQKGVEAVSKVMMPILIALSIFIVIYVMFLPNAMDGVLYYITPKLEDFSVTTVLAALGQLFYSMSLAMGIMITYGSYMKKKDNIETCVHQIEFFDTGIAFLAGMMIVPAVFITSGGNISSGPGLMFETLPQVFNGMSGGAIIGVLFFALVFLAALTSSISIAETIVSMLCDRFGIKRSTACFLIIVICIIFGVPSSLGSGVLSDVKILGMSILDFFDFITNSVIMPIVALCTCIFIGYVVKPKLIIDEVESSAKFKLKKLFIIMIKYIAPVFIFLILVSSLLNGLGIIKI